MNYSILWSTRARRTYESILVYLEKEWTQKEVLSFVNRTEEIVSYLESDPHIYEASKKKLSVHRCVVVKQVSLYYKIVNTNIELLFFWDNRQHPNRLKY